MRAAGLFIGAALISFPAWAAPRPDPSFNDPLPTRNCPKAFLAEWSRSPETVPAGTPERPCWMRTKTGPYVCHRGACVRAHVYFDGN